MVIKDYTKIVNILFLYVLILYTSHIQRLYTLICTHRTSLSSVCTLILCTLHILGLVQPVVLVDIIETFANAKNYQFVTTCKSFYPGAGICQAAEAFLKVANDFRLIGTGSPPPRRTLAPLPK